MQTVVLVIHVLIALGLIAVVLWQRSEGGALGIGGGGGGFLTGRGTANLLTRATAMLAAAFFTTSILLTILAQQGGPKGSALDSVNTPASTTAPAEGTTPAVPGTLVTPAPAPEAPRGGILDKLK